MSGLSNFLGNVYGEDDDSTDDDNPPVKTPEQDQRLEPSLNDVRDSMEALLADADPDESLNSPPVTWAETISASELDDPLAVPEAVGSPDPPENPTDDWFSRIDGPGQVPEAIPVPNMTSIASAAKTASTPESTDQEDSEPHLPSFLEEVGRTEIDNSWLDEIEESAQFDEIAPEPIVEDPVHGFIEEAPAQLPEPPPNELTSSDFEVPDLATDDDDQPWIDELLLRSEPEAAEDSAATQTTNDHPIDPLSPESSASLTDQDAEHSNQFDPLGDSQPVPVEDPPTPTEDDIPAAQIVAEPQMAPIPIWVASRDDIIPGQEMQTFHRPMVTSDPGSESDDTPMVGIEGLPVPEVPKERRGRRRSRRSTPHHQCHQQYSKRHPNSMNHQSADSCVDAQPDRTWPPE